MVNAGRVACITAPFLLSLAALVCLVLVFLAGAFERNETLDNLYFFKIDMRNLTLTSSANLLGTDTSNNLTVLEGALEAAKQSLGMKDFYTIYLRNYCAWNGNDHYAYCSPRQSYFWFDPITVWGLNRTGTDVDTLLPKSFRDSLSIYEKFSKATFLLYAAALAATCVTLVVGISAIFSRWGSLITTFFASCSGLLLLIASILASVMFAVVKGAFNETLKKDYGINSAIGTRSLSVTWIGVAFAVGAGFFWTLSVFCCSGRSPYNPGGKEARRTRAEKTPYTYERVGSPYLGPRDSQAVPLQPVQNQGRAQQGGSRAAAYEPFRPQRA